MPSLTGEEFASAAFVAPEWPDSDFWRFSNQVTFVAPGGYSIFYAINHLGGSPFEVCEWSGPCRA